MKSDEEYNEMTKIAAFAIVNALSVFKNEDPGVREKLTQITNNRVNRMLNGEPVVIEGEGLVTVIDNPPEDDNDKSEDQI